MREIKFRAWDQEQNRLRMVAGPSYLRRMNIQGSNLTICDGLTDTGDYLEIPEDAILMQFTGLRDKNGREVFEGDVILFPWGKEREPRRFKIVFDERQAGFKMKPIKRSKDVWACWLPMPDEIKVIGNIYETPELLK